MTNISDEQEIINAIALTQVANVGIINAKVLYEKFGSATAVMEHRHDIGDVFGKVSPKIVESLKNTDAAFRVAYDEMKFMQNVNVKALCLNNKDYPQRMAQCPDAPVILFYCGTADLNSQRIVSVVGTRNITEYGKSLCRTFVEDLKDICPDTVIVSGLAYGVDIHGHRAALANGMNTVGVVAHGLEKIYPQMHHDTAKQMVSQGGILTEYVHGTVIEKGNFLRRNRIVAGISDACIVVESASHGGSLVTADIANSYDREVFTFPGRAFDEHSRGCNKLIKENKAMLIENAEDFVVCMGWNEKKDRRKVIQGNLFADEMDGLNEDEKKIIESLKNIDSKSVNLIVNETGLSFGTVSALVFELESKGFVDVLGGARIKIRNGLF